MAYFTGGTDTFTGATGTGVGPFAGTTGTGFGTLTGTAGSGIGTLTCSGDCTGLCTCTGACTGAYTEVVTTGFCEVTTGTCCSTGIFFVTTVRGITDAAGTPIVTESAANTIGVFPSIVLPRAVLTAFELLM